MIKLILASGSPRRREILQNLGIPFEVVTSDADEHCELTDPAAYVRELAARKGLAVREELRRRGVELQDTLILAADTVVAQDSTILGKPADRNDAVRMLTELAGRDHAVYSGIALLMGDTVATASERTAVHVAPLTHEQILRYVATGEPDDKAGSYAMQGLFSPYITGIEGCYFNVVGLPVHALFALAKDTFDIDLYSLRG